MAKKKGLPLKEECSCLNVEREIDVPAHYDAQNGRIVISALELKKCIYSALNSFPKSLHPYLRFAARPPINFEREPRAGFCIAIEELPKRIASYYSKSLKKELKNEQEKRTTL